MSKNKYSLKQLINIKRDIENFFQVEEKISTKLAYALNKNKRILNEEIETLKEKLKDGVEELSEYRKEVHNKLEECGAKKKMSAQGATQLTDMENVDINKYEKELEKLDKKYAKELEKQEKINEENEKIASEKVADVELYMIDFDYFPEEINPKAFTDNISLLIKEDE